MDEKGNGNIIKLPVKQSEIQKYDLSPLIEYSRHNNKRLSDLSPAEMEQYRYYENVQRLALWELHYIQGSHCRIIIRIDDSKILNAAIEHDDIANAPSFEVVEVDGVWQLMIAHVPYCSIENWTDVEKCVKDVQELWEEKCKWYLQNYLQLRLE